MGGVWLVRLGGDSLRETGGPSSSMAKKGQMIFGGLVTVLNFQKKEIKSTMAQCSVKGIADPVKHRKKTAKTGKWNSGEEVRSA